MFPPHLERIGRGIFHEDGLARSQFGGLAGPQLVVLGEPYFLRSLHGLLGDDSGTGLDEPVVAHGKLAAVEAPGGLGGFAF